MREVSRTAPAQALAYSDPRGSISLRRVLAAYLRRVRGADAGPGRIVICAGFAQGINLVLRALPHHGVRQVALEDPGEYEPDSGRRRWGLEGIPVSVDERGIDVRALAAD